MHKNISAYYRASRGLPVMAELCFKFVLLQLVTADSQTDGQSPNQNTDHAVGTDVTTERIGGIVNSRPSSFQ